MNSVFIIASQVFRVLLFVFFGVLVFVSVIGIWTYLGDLIRRLLSGCKSFHDSKKYKLIVIITWILYVVITLFCIVFGVSFIIGAIVEGVWWFYLLATLLLLVFPGIVIFVVSELIEQQRRAS